MTLGITLELLTSYNPILRPNAIHRLNIHEGLECPHHDKRGRLYQCFSISYPDVAFQMDGWG